MAKKKKTSRKKTSTKAKATKTSRPFFSRTSLPKPNRYVTGISYVVLALFFIMSALGSAGRIGEFIHEIVLMDTLGYGFFVLPLIFLFLAYRQFKEIRHPTKDSIGIIVAVLSLLGLIDIFFSRNDFDASGVIGKFIGSNLVAGFDRYFSSVLLLGLIGIAAFIIFDPKLRSLKKIQKNLEERRASNEEHHESAAAIDEQVQKATEEHEARSPSEEPSEKKSFAIAAITPKSKKNDDDNLNIDDAAVFASSYTPPPLSLLGKSGGKPSTGDIKANANLIKRTLKNFGIDVEMDEISIGPTVTRYAMKPAQGVRLSKIAGLQNELALALAAKSIRIEAPIPGRSLVGIEVPNTKKSKIGLGSLLSEDAFKDPSKPLLVSLGKGVSGKSHFANIAKMPHALIAGATGAGKSVTIHNIVMSLLYKNGPDMLRFIMIDPKRVEMTLYKKIPHLLTPVITNPKKAVLALKWAVKEMERRYDVLEDHSVQNINAYHKGIVQPAYKDLSAEDVENRSGELPEKMPYIVIVIDELSDIMSTYPRELEASIVRLAQMSRAVGIHLLLATQRPDVNVITGLIKANIPTRLAMKVTSQIDSRTILDKKGAEKLLGYGDMLYKGEGSNEPVRIQCPFVSDAEVKSVVSYIQKHYQFELEDTIALPDEQLQDGGGGVSLADDKDDDPLYEDARQTVLNDNRASTSHLQRKLSIGYNRAARIMDTLEERGIIGPQDGAKAREILVAREESSAHGDDEADEVDDENHYDD